MENFSDPDFYTNNSNSPLNELKDLIHLNNSINSPTTANLSNQIYNDGDEDDFENYFLRTQLNLEEIAEVSEVEASIPLTDLEEGPSESTVLNFPFGTVRIPAILAAVKTEAENEPSPAPQIQIPEKKTTRKRKREDSAVSTRPRKLRLHEEPELTEKNRNAKAAYERRQREKETTQALKSENEKLVQLVQQLQAEKSEILENSKKLQEENQNLKVFTLRSARLLGELKAELMERLSRGNEQIKNINLVPGLLNSSPGLGIEASAEFELNYHLAVVGRGNTWNIDAVPIDSNIP